MGINFQIKVILIQQNKVIIILKIFRVKLHKEKNHNMNPNQLKEFVKNAIHMKTL